MPWLNSSLKPKNFFLSFFIYLTIKRKMNINDWKSTACDRFCSETWWFQQVDAPSQRRWWEELWKPMIPCSPMWEEAGEGGRSQANDEAKHIHRQTIEQDSRQTDRRYEWELQHSWNQAKSILSMLKLCSIT